MSWLKPAAVSQHLLIVIMTDCEVTVARFSDFFKKLVNMVLSQHLLKF